MAPEIARTDPPYIQIARRIREDIESGVLAEGSAIPSAREITATWGVALATATKVHAWLRSEGLIESVPGVGSIVRRQDVASGQQRLSATHTRGRIYGVNEHAIIRSSEVVAAPAAVSDALGIDEGAPVVRRERVIMRDDRPESYSLSWLPADRIEDAPLLRTTERIREGTFAYLAKALGSTVTSGREQTTAGLASAEQAERLGVDPGSPVLQSRIWYFLEDGTVVEYGESAQPAGRWVTHDFQLT